MANSSKIQTRNDSPFSKLSENLLLLIISFLPFKEAARTSILSKQWRHIWRSTANIDFSESFLINPNDSKQIRIEKRTTFVNFAKNWIHNFQGVSVKNLALSFSNPENFIPDILDIVNFALRRNTKSLRLDFSSLEWKENDKPASALNLPSEFYQQILESLVLISVRFVPSMCRFRSLKELSLGWIELRACALRTLLRNSPSLQTLSIKNCWDMDEVEITETNLSLKKLEFQNCRFIHGIWVSIEGPNLHFFKYSGCVGNFYMENQRCIEEAELDFGLETDFDAMGDFLYNILEQLFSAKVLTVDSYLLQVIPDGTEVTGLRNPLSAKHLILKTSLHINEFIGIKFLLKSCPSIEALTIQLGPATNINRNYVAPYEFDPVEFWTTNLISYKCFRTSLKVVEVKGFRGRVHEICLLQYLLVLGRLLEHLNIFLANEDASNVEIYRRRALHWEQKFKIASKSLRINIY